MATSCLTQPWGFPGWLRALGLPRLVQRSAEPGSTPFHKGSGEKVTETNVLSGQGTQNLKYSCKKVSVSTWQLNYQIHEFPTLKTRNLRARCEQGWFILGPLVKGKLRHSEKFKGEFAQIVIVTSV